MLLIEETKSYGSKTQLLATAYSLLTASECPRIGLSPSLPPSVCLTGAGPVMAMSWQAQSWPHKASGHQHQLIAS